MYNIAIIGLGPAGSTLARLLSPTLHVIAIDRKSDPSTQKTAPPGFEKPCGGLLARDAQKALSKFNLTLPKDVLVDPQIFAVKTIDLKQHLTRHYQRFYINLDRAKFDGWLIGLIPKNVTVAHDAHCTKIERMPDGFAVTYRKDGQEQTVHAHYIIGADGSHSLTRKLLFGDPKIQRYLSIQQTFLDPRIKPFYSCIFDRDITDSYCWGLSKDGRFILGGAFPVKDARKRFEQLKTAMISQGYALNDPMRTQACMVSRPRTPRDFCVAAQNAFLVGEAAGFISPSSLEGISYALDSAQILADVLNGGAVDPCRAYRTKTRLMRLKLMLKTAKSQFMYRPFLRKLVMSSGVQSIKVVDTKPT